MNVVVHGASGRMRAASFAAVGLLLASLAGCVADDEPSESTEGPPVGSTPANPTATTPAPTAPTGDGFVVLNPGEVLVPAEQPPPAASPTPPPAEEPSPAPEAPASPPASEPEAEPEPEPPTDPTPEPDEGSWPREGSFVTVRGSASDSAPNTFVNSTEWTAAWRYEDGDWVGECEGTWEMDWDESTGNEDASGSFSRELSVADPPHWPLLNTRDPPDEGESVQVWVMWGCDIESASMVYSGLNEGRHRADDTQEAEENYSDFTTFWDPDTGLVLEWDWSRRTSGTSGRLTATDAPGL